MKRFIPPTVGATVLFLICLFVPPRFSLIHSIGMVMAWVSGYWVGSLFSVHPAKVGRPTGRKDSKPRARRTRRVVEAPLLDSQSTEGGLG